MLEGFLPAATIVVLGECLTGDAAAVLLSRGVPSIHKPINPFVLSMLALDLTAEASPARVAAVVSHPAAVGALERPSPSFENLVAAYASSRRLSKQQALILDLYLNGKSDKEIAEHCACSGATVYEHWRRMAKKSGGRSGAEPGAGASCSRAKGLRPALAPPGSVPRPPDRPTGHPASPQALSPQRT